MTNQERKLRYDSLEALGIQCDTIVNSDGEPVITQWSDHRPEMTWEEIMAAAAAIPRVKKWPTVAEFYAEFKPGEQYGIQTSESPAVVVALGQLTMWRGEVVADDSRIVAGMQALIDDGIISEARRDEILGSD